MCDLPGEVVEADASLFGPRRIGTDREQREIVVVVGRARAAGRRGAVPIVPDDLEVERLLVEGGGRLRVAHVEDGMVESLHRNHAVRNPLSRSTIPGNTSTNASMSASVDDQPTLARAASGRRRRPSPPAPATARASRTSTTSPSAPRPRAGRGRAGSARPRRPRRRGTRGAGGSRSRVAEALDAGHGVERRPRERDRVNARAASASRSSPPPVSSRAPRRRSRRSRARSRCRRAGPAPARRRRRTAGSRSPRRTSSAPAPFGPPNLCAVTEQRSAPSAAKSTGDVPGGRARVDVHDDVALARAPRTISAAGCSVPTSWFASCTDTSAVSGRIASSTSPASKRPAPSTPTTVTLGPRPRAARRSTPSARPRW